MNCSMIEPIRIVGTRRDWVLQLLRIRMCKPEKSTGSFFHTLQERELRETGLDLNGTSLTPNSYSFGEPTNWFPTMRWVEQ